MHPQLSNLLNSSQPPSHLPSPPSHLPLPSIKSLQLSKASSSSPPTTNYTWKPSTQPPSAHKGDLPSPPSFPPIKAPPLGLSLLSESALKDSPIHSSHSSPPLSFSPHNFYADPSYIQSVASVNDMASQIKDLSSAILSTAASASSSPPPTTQTYPIPPHTLEKMIALASSQLSIFSSWKSSFEAAHSAFHEPRPAAAPTAPPPAPPPLPKIHSPTLPTSPVSSLSHHPPAVVPAVSSTPRFPISQSIGLLSFSATSPSAPPPASTKRGKRKTVPGADPICLVCKAVETPEWRRGPEGARTLCNACGLHYSKAMKKSKKEVNEWLQSYRTALSRNTPSSPTSQTTDHKEPSDLSSEALLSSKARDLLGNRRRRRSRSSSSSSPQPQNMVVLNMPASSLAKQPTPENKQKLPPLGQVSSSVPPSKTSGFVSFGQAPPPNRTHIQN